MQTVRRLPAGVTDDSLRVAILAGLATVPFTLLLSEGTMTVDGGGFDVSSSVAGEPLLVAAVIVGYYYRDREPGSRRAGIWTGLAGSIAVVLTSLASAITAITSASLQTAALTVVLASVTILLGIGVLALVTMVTAQLTGLATARLSSDHRFAASADATADSRWWNRLLVAYALVAPVALGNLAVEPDGGVALAAFLGLLFALVPLAPLTFVALFVDSTAPREPETEWVPTVWAYLCPPLAGFAVVYAVASLEGVYRPGGPATFGFIGVLWAVVVVYLLQRYRHAT